MIQKYLCLFMLPSGVFATVLVKLPDLLKLIFINAVTYGEAMSVVSPDGRYDQVLRAAPKCQKYWNRHCAYL